MSSGNGLMSFRVIIKVRWVRVLGLPWKVKTLCFLPPCSQSKRWSGSETAQLSLPYSSYPFSSSQRWSQIQLRSAQCTASGKTHSLLLLPLVQFPCCWPGCLGSERSRTQWSIHGPLTDDGLWVISSPLSVFVSRVLLEYHHAHSFLYCLWLLLCYHGRAE